MPARTTSKTLTIRLDTRLYGAAQNAARKREMSLNALVQQSIVSLIRQDDELVRFDEYTSIGNDADLVDVAYATHAQAEVMLSE